MIQTTIIGNIRTLQTKEGELTVISVASNRPSGQTSIWTSCNLWGEKSTRFKNFLVKGQKVYVQGRAESRAFTRTNGDPAAEIVVHVDYLLTLGPGVKPVVEVQEAEPADTDSDINEETQD